MQEHRHERHDECAHQGRPVPAALGAHELTERHDEPVGRAASEFNERVARRERPVVKPGAQNEERPENGGDDAENELKKRCQHEFPTPEEKG